MAFVKAYKNIYNDSEIKKCSRCNYVIDELRTSICHVRFGWLIVLSLYIWKETYTKVYTPF